MEKTTSSPSRIIFEEINMESLSLIRSSIWKGNLVYYVSLADSVKKIPFIEQNINAKKILDIMAGGTDYFLFLRAGICAHTIVDEIFEKFISKTLSLKIVKILFCSADLENMYKKALLVDLQRIIHHQLQINAVISDISGSVEFYPKDDYWLYSDKSTFFSDSVAVKKLPFHKTALRRFSSKTKELFIQAYPVYLLLRKVGIPTLRCRNRKAYVLGINVNLPSLFGYNRHYIDFIVEDLYGFPKTDILFVDERYKPVTDTSFTEHGYDYYDTMNVRERLSVGFLFKNIFMKFFPAWGLCTLLAFSEKSLITRVTRTILSDFVKWNIFCECYSLGKHASILLEDTLSKNMILKKHGIETWYIYPDNYTLDYHTGWDENESICFYNFTYMHFDHAVVFGYKTRRYFSCQKNTIKNYHCIGVLSSQRIREVREGKIASHLPSLIREKTLTGKIVGVFDTTFVDTGPLKIKDGIKFAKDLLQLLADVPEISIIFKEKKFLHITPELAPVYEQLENHPRCLVIRRTEDNQIFSTEVIAQSDLVISAAYSSTGAEALCAKTKAIYYDVAGTDRGEQFYFNSFPQFVAHDYHDLHKLVRYWLFESSDEDFNHFLQTFVKGEIDPYLDGRAIDRLQGLLRENGSPDVPP